jgi:lycopene beta-cyclase
MNFNQTTNYPNSLRSMRLSTGYSRLIAVWTLGMISVPIALWTLGDSALPWIISVNVVILAVANILILLRYTPIVTGLRIIVVILVGAWIVEYLGSTTGFPFSHYDYTPLLQPQIMGVPAIIPLAWLMMLPASWVVGQLLAPSNYLRQVLIAGLAMTAWDLFLDPQMVAWNFWQWATPVAVTSPISMEAYFGIPWINFAGWFVSAVVLTLAARPPRLPARPLLLIYTLTWALQSIGLALFWQMPGPALFGFVAMGIFVVLGWWRASKNRTADQPLPASR